MWKWWGPCINAILKLDKIAAYLIRSIPAVCHLIAPLVDIDALTIAAGEFMAEFTV